MDDRANSRSTSTGGAAGQRVALLQEPTSMCDRSLLQLTACHTGIRLKALIQTEPTISAKKKHLLQLTSLCHKGNPVASCDPQTLKAAFHWGNEKPFPSYAAKRKWERQAGKAGGARKARQHDYDGTSHSCMPPELHPDSTRPIPQLHSPNKLWHVKDGTGHMCPVQLYAA